MWWFAFDVKEGPGTHPSSSAHCGLGSLLLFMFAADRVATHLMEVHILLRTDNKGNAYAAEPSAQEHKRAVFALLHHVKRCSNVWADQLWTSRALTRSAESRW